MKIDNDDSMPNNNWRYHLLQSSILGSTDKTTMAADTQQKRKKKIKDDDVISSDDWHYRLFQSSILGHTTTTAAENVEDDAAASNRNNNNEKKKNGSTAVVPPLEELIRKNSTMSQHSTATNSSLSTIHSNNTKVVDGLSMPNRLVDFFCVLGGGTINNHNGQVVVLSGKGHSANMKKRPRMENDSSLQQSSHLISCYPKNRPDMEFPDHIHSFCFPVGCHAVTTSSSNEEPKPPLPTIMTFVLTSSNGQRLYCSALTFYETTTQLLSKENQKSSNNNDDKSTNKTTTACRHHEHQGDGDEVYHYLPKSLVVVSHYAFFNVFRTFLQQIYRIYKSGTSPLPLERYIANFVDDVPLPPTRAKIRWECFTHGCFVDISWSPQNRLPMVNFSYQPLFSTLSVANILVVWGILLTEGRVALFSKHHSLLTPVSEALLSLLFPLRWQGLYVPVLPTNMQDLLDAPVPFLVGLDSTYLKDPKKQQQPANVVFVDLDEDVVHLRWDDSANMEWKTNSMPDLPDRAAMELKIQLEELVDHLYLVPTCGVKGRMTIGDDVLLENASREPYAQMTRLHEGTKNKDKNHRRFILSNAERAFVDLEKSELLKPQDYILSNNREKELMAGQLSEKSITEDNIPKRNSSVMMSLKRKTRTIQAHTDRLMAAYAGQHYATPNPFNAGDSDRALTRKRFHLATSFYELDESNSDKKEALFSSKAIREAFLDFFVNLLCRYKKFTTGTVKGDIIFKREAFVKDLPLSHRNRQYILTLVQTQMFERFLHDNSKLKTFFDEKIVLKLNRETVFGKSTQPTPFLDDPRWKVRKVMKPPAPYKGHSLQKNTYAYGEFPKLMDEEFKSQSNAPAYEGWSTLCAFFLCWPGA